MPSASFALSAAPAAALAAVQPPSPARLRFIGGLSAAALRLAKEATGETTPARAVATGGLQLPDQILQLAAGALDLLVVGAWRACSLAQKVPQVFDLAAGVLRGFA